ncbi:MAG: aminoacyl-tRNA hydrolase, partial [Oscillospiraceae bacterium]|nr:aminoacyl-tRNA hydrolase [Oscillospiraceae bacterium]
VRVGVGAKPHPDYDLADWVLSRFSAEEEGKIRDAVANAAGAVETLLSDGVEAAASRYNGK